MWLNLKMLDGTIEKVRTPGIDRVESGARTDDGVYPVTAFNASGEQVGTWYVVSFSGGQGPQSHVQASATTTD